MGRRAESMRKTLHDRSDAKSCRIPLITGDLRDEENGSIRCAGLLPLRAGMRCQGFVYGRPSVVADRPPGLGRVLEMEVPPAAEPAALAEVWRYTSIVRTRLRRLQPIQPSQRREIYPPARSSAVQSKGQTIASGTWCRTGFTGALLAGLFPQQRVLSLWEGNLGVSATMGFQ